ncbi:MAG: hypothetical protein KAH01_01380 [Caldisericia bacterium]|nr:hypothetical protein [Caldisericia bacterium]
MSFYGIWLLLPLICTSILIVVQPKKQRTLGFLMVIFTIILIVLLVLQNPFYLSTCQTVTLSNHGPFHLSFTIDKFAWITSLFCLLVWLFSSLYSMGYFLKEPLKRIKRYQIFSMLNLYSILLILNSNNWVTFFIFFELLLVVSYMIIIHYQKPENYAAGIRYVFFQVIGGLFFLTAIMFQYKIVGSTAFVPGGYAKLAQSPYFIIIFLGFIVAFAIKAGLFPVHIWLPEAHPVAPSPASALLSGMVIKTGMVGLLRMVLQTFGIEQLIGKPCVYVLLTIALITMFWGSAVAIAQKHIKRMLAYSSVSQMGYISMGVMLLSPIGLLGGLMHILAHSMVKTLLFLSAGSMIQQNNSSDVTSYAGYGQRSPIVFTGFTVGALSMIGFPFFANFITKWALGVGAIEAIQLGYINNWMGGLAIGILLFSSILNALYYLPIIIQGWFHSQNEENGEVKDKNAKQSVERYKTPVCISITMISLVLIVIAFGVFPGPIIEYCRAILSELTPLQIYPHLF